MDLNVRLRGARTYRRICCAVIGVVVGVVSACGAQTGRSSAYKNGYSHGSDAFEAEPLVENGALAPRSEFKRACREVASFYVVPDADRPEWVTGCVAGAKDFSK
jgi:hypothetical protein